MDELIMSSPEGQEVFQRVWQRVMGSRSQPDTPDQAAPVMAPADVSPPAPQPCFQAAPPCPVLSSPLRQQVADSLEGWQFCRLLARRMGQRGRPLSLMAGELHRQARQLSASYFLLTGVRYWPVEALTAPAIPSWPAALRTRYHQEEQQGRAFRTAAQHEEDTALAELYQTLAQESAQRCRRLRQLLEGSGR